MITKADIIIKCLEHFLEVAYLREGGGIWGSYYILPGDQIFNLIRHLLYNNMKII